MPTPEEQMAAMLASIEASNALADHLNQLKVNLETRGWSSAASEQAAIVTTNTMMQLSVMSAR